ncbi:hypothetical protein [Legionella clemsonensis]|uniref:Uncharacterized protein n=1 Tax=Legionella clemsonensis TaxID=1867846 RepID=A0A222P413_9GAMM|nr:hypothetical protein [Legionella clemsonensis]ASQ46573.1 hypothetical protein clem_10120 [Legionella clemsonensis]
MREFDSKTHSKQLQEGSADITRTDAIYIKHMSANVKGNGFGRALMRAVVTEALEQNKKIFLDASWSSHIFHLFMGMIPRNLEQSYVEMMYGIVGKSALQALKQCKTLEDCTRLTNRTRETLLFILEKEMPESENTLENIFNKREQLLELLKKRASFITYRFIPDLLDILEREITEKYPNTEGLYSVPMELSQEGQARWDEAIHKNIEFESFKGFEQLYPFMTEEQKERLNLILHYRPLVLTHLPLNFQDKHSPELIDEHKNVLLLELKNVFNDEKENSNPLVMELIKKITYKIENAAKTQQKLLEKSFQQTLQDINSIDSSFDKKVTKEAIQSHKVSLLSELDKIVKRAQNQVVFKHPEYARKFKDAIAEKRKEINNNADNRVISIEENFKMLVQQIAQIKIEFSQESMDALEAYRQELMKKLQEFEKEIEKISDKESYSEIIHKKQQEIESSYVARKKAIEVVSVIQQMEIDFTSCDNRDAIEAHKASLLAQLNEKVVTEKDQTLTQASLLQKTVSDRKQQIEESALARGKRVDSIEKSVKAIDTILATLQGKIGEVKQHHSKEALRRAKGLLTTLKESRDNYYENLLAKDDQDIPAGEVFLTSCKQAINEAKPVLIEDLGWGRYLHNLLKELANAVIKRVPFGNSLYFFKVSPAESASAVSEAEDALLNRQVPK